MDDEFIPMHAENSVNTDDTLAKWETPTLTTFEASDAEAGAGPIGDGVLSGPS